MLPVGGCLVLVEDIAAAHQFEDGVVERTLAVRIRDGQGDIEYAIGLNDATLERFIDAWPDDRALIKAIDEADENAANENEAHENEAHEKSGERAADGVANNESMAHSSAPTPAEPVAGELVNELQLIRQFAKIATPNLQANVRVLADEQLLPLTLVSAEPSSRHHATLIVRWQFQLPKLSQGVTNHRGVTNHQGVTNQIAIHDGNFLRQPGGAKCAFKTAGSAMLVRSDVAPILVRSDRTVLDTVPAWTRWQKPVIQATVRRLQQPVDVGKPSLNPTRKGATTN